MVSKITLFRICILAVAVLSGGMAAAQPENETESVTGSIRARDGKFYLDIAYGPGMFNEFLATGSPDLLSKAAEETERIFETDAETGMVGRMDTLRVLIKKLEGGGVEVLSYSSLEEERSGGGGE